MQFAELKRREFITLIGGMAAALPLAARARQPAMPVVGLFTLQSRESVGPFFDAFRRGLAGTPLRPIQFPSRVPCLGLYDAFVRLGWR
jgi:hypothetical protein